MSEVLYDEDGVTVEREDLTDPADLLAIEQVEELKKQFEVEVKPPSLKGYLKVKCTCGYDGNVTDEVIEDGISWMMLFNNDHWLQLTCPECHTALKMYLEEIKDNEETPVVAQITPDGQFYVAGAGTTKEDFIKVIKDELPQESNAE